MPGAACPWMKTWSPDSPWSLPRKKWLNPTSYSEAAEAYIATYASAASLYEVGFNHFFRGKDHGESGDQVFIQGHAAPGIYARAFLEGRLTETQLDGFRQEKSHRGGLPSY